MCTFATENKNDVGGNSQNVQKNRRNTLGYGCSNRKIQCRE